jgi:streptomycin 6-kinase
VPPTVIPPTLCRNVVETWGADGERWLADLPALVATVARDWDLDIGATYTLTYHYVAAATLADGAAAVLKLGLPQPGHLAVEAAALELYGGHGAVRLLKHDVARGALLLERAHPGTPVSALVPHRDEEATAAIVAVTARLHRALPDSPLPDSPPPDSRLPDLTAERASFAAYLRKHPADRPLPRHLVERAGRLFDELCATATRRVVLHGDLHHDNVLRADREPWLAIDPHGLIGDPGYELGALLYNPAPARRDDALLALVPARIEQLADGLGQSPERVIAWGFVKAVLSEVWTVQGSGTPGSRALDVALRLFPHLP